jgi:N-acetylglucosaminyl-diphospho-decaprenol L-rhamnosyltransferase
VKSSLDIIIVNWNAGPYLRRCLGSIERPIGEGFELARVVVVDNASADGSADGLDFPELPLTVVRNVENRGFAAACNQGARGTAADYLLFLNPDMRLCEGSLKVPIRFMEEPSNAQVGICGIQLLDESGEVSRSSSWFPSGRSLFSQMLGLDRLFPSAFRGHFLRDSKHVESGPVDQVIGAFLLIRGRLFASLEGFDERFFMYWEDVDISYRAKMSGWSSYYLARAQAYHKGNASSDQVKPARLFYTLRSRILYAQKHFGRMQAALVALGTVLVEPLSRFVLGACRGSVRTIQETCLGYAMLWRVLPGLLVSRTSGNRGGPMAGGSKLSAGH